MNIACYVAYLLVFEAIVRGFKFFDWGQGPARASLLALIALLLLTLRYRPHRLLNKVNDCRWWRMIVLGAVSVLVVWNALLAARSVIYTAKTGVLRMDQAQSTYRAAAELWRDENPYGQGAILDPISYLRRMPKRIAAGIGPAIPAATVGPELFHYWQTLSPTIRDKLLPAVPPTRSELARREASILGYKYGPVPVLVTAAAKPFLGPAAVALANYVAWLALFVVIALILRLNGAGIVGSGCALMAVMIDPHIRDNFILGYTSDVWALLFGFTAVLCAMRGRRSGLGLSLALALGSKVFPSILYLPLLITVRSMRSVFVFGTTMVALYLPWVVWDAHGLFYNLLLWPVLIDSNSTSWIHYAPMYAIIPIRAALAVLLASLTWMLISAQERRWCWLFAAMNVTVCAAGPVFENNYVPWFSIWCVLATAEAFFAPPAFPLDLIPFPPSFPQPPRPEAAPPDHRLGFRERGRSWDAPFVA